jgi:hypothetical protein
MSNRNASTHPFPQGHLYRVTFRVNDELRVTNVVVPNEGDILAVVYLIDRSWPDAVVMNVETAGPVEGDLLNTWAAQHDVKVPPAPTTLPTPLAEGQEVTKPPHPYHTHTWNPSGTMCLRCGCWSDSPKSGNVCPESQEVSRHTHPADVPKEAGGYAASHDWCWDGGVAAHRCLKCGEVSPGPGPATSPRPCRPSRQAQAAMATQTVEYGLKEKTTGPTPPPEIDTATGMAWYKGQPRRESVDQTTPPAPSPACKLDGCDYHYGPGTHDWKPHCSGASHWVECDRCGHECKKGQETQFPRCPGGKVVRELRHEYPDEDNKGMPRCLHCHAQMFGQDWQKDICPARAKATGRSSENYDA